MTEYVSAGGHEEKTADVYCVHQRDGSIIPIRIRIEDEDGESQSYLVKGYRQIDFEGNTILPSGVGAGSNTNLSYECKIMVFDKERRVRLLYRKFDGKWIVCV